MSTASPSRPSAQRLRIIVSGLIAQYPLGGVTWDYIQYVAGLAALGHDVYYVEDTGQWPYNPQELGVSKGCEFNIEYLALAMERFGLQERWAYCFPCCFPGASQWFGLSSHRVDEIVSTADLVINVSGTLQRPERYAQRARLVYIDSDPVFTQVKLARGQEGLRRLIAQHDVVFSFGETMPDGLKGPDQAWRPTRQPVVLDEWTHDGACRDVYTTVMNWTSYKPIYFDGRTYGQKDVELKRFLDLPSRVKPVCLEIAMAAGKTSRAPVDLLRHRGWRIVDPDEACSDADRYRAYVQQSKAEWSVAKNGYVVGRAGWFSCRSACYLAAGRPVIVQDTGFSPVLPVGEGLLVFRDLEEAVAGIQEIEARYARHAKAARELAREFFDARVVLAALLERAMSPPH